MTVKNKGRDLCLDVRRRSNLRRAWQKVYEDGISSKSEETRRGISEFQSEQETRLRRIERKLQKGTFTFTPAKGILKTRPGKSPRPIVSAVVGDRIVRRSILDVLQRLPDIARFYENPYSFGGIGGKSVADAVRLSFETIRENASWYVRSDIDSFFTKIPRVTVLSKIKSVIDDQQFITLLEDATATELDNLAQLGTRAEAFPLYEIGVAQGCCLSPLIGNILLDGFDARMNGNDVICLRYIDDFLILGSSKESVTKAFELALTLLSAHGLSAYSPGSGSEKAKFGPTRKGLEFLGCEMTPGLIKPNRKSRVRLLNNLGEIVETSLVSMKNPKRAYVQRCSLVETLYKLNNVLRGWGNQYSFCNDGETLKNLDLKVDSLVGKLIAEYSKYRRQYSDESPKANGRRLLGVYLLSDTS